MTVESEALYLTFSGISYDCMSMSVDSSKLLSGRGTRTSALRGEVPLLGDLTIGADRGTKARAVSQRETWITIKQLS